MLPTHSLPGGLLLTLAAALSQAGDNAGIAIQAVPVTQEPLHVVVHRGEHFMVYTNWIEPGVWTLYHEHRNDLLAVIAADTAAASQLPGAEPQQQAAPAGTLVFFPYADSDVAFVHRVGGRGSSPFINIGLEFQDSIAAACPARRPGWNEARAEVLAPNRRGQGYRLQLPVAATVALPQHGRGLLIVPLAEASLEIDGEEWSAVIGDFRFYDRDLPGSIRNSGTAAVTVVFFDAC